MPYALPSYISIFAEKAAALLFPPICHGCGELRGENPELPLCPECMEALEPVPSPRCTKCGKPFIAEGGENRVCGECLVKKKHFDFAFSAYLYSGPASEAIHRLKYKKNVSAARVLARLLAQRLADERVDISDYEAIIPVPLHYTRMASRGFNQAALISSEFAAITNAKVLTNVLKRGRATPSQVSLPRNKRAENVKNAFVVPDSKEIEGKRLIVLDDVYTTGATNNEIARALKKAGADAVMALTIARVELDII